MTDIRQKKTIGILLISTWKYNEYIDDIVSDIRKFIFSDHNIKIFLHTNSKSQHNVDCTIQISHKPWPLITLNRFHFFHSNRFKYDSDYLFYMDVDSRINHPLNDSKILDHNLFAVEHCGWRGTRGTPERNPRSKAYISKTENSHPYVAGGFFGGKTKNFLEMSYKLKQNIDADKRRKIIAIWHDESHLNRYVINNNIPILPYKYLYIDSYHDDDPYDFTIMSISKSFNKYRNEIKRKINHEE